MTQQEPFRYYIITGATGALYWVELHRTYKEEHIAMKKHHCIICAASLLLSVGACAGPGQKQAAIQPQQEATQLKAASVQERAEAYWNYRTKGDFAQAYAIESPELRKGATLTNYIKGMGAGMVIRAFIIESLEEKGDIATIMMRINFYSMGAPKPKEGITRTVPDYWQRIDGVWYHIFRKPEAPSENTPAS